MIKENKRILEHNDLTQLHLQFGDTQEQDLIDDEIKMPKIETSAREDFHALRIEYTRLFTTPKASRFRLYESLARGKSKMLFENPVAKHAESCYVRAGLQIENRQQEPADFMPTEFEFASLLLADLAADVMEADTVLPISQEQCEGLWQEFYREHLAEWQTAFWQEVAKDTTSDFYRRLALTSSILFSKEW